VPRIRHLRAQRLRIGYRERSAEPHDRVCFRADRLSVRI